MQEPGPAPPPPPSKPEAFTSVQFTEPSCISLLYPARSRLDGEHCSYQAGLINLDDSDTASSYY